MAIETYAELQSSVADWLLRDDIDDVIPDFIHNAESQLKRGVAVNVDGKEETIQVRKFVFDTLSVNSEEENLPDDFHSMEILAHDTSSHAGGLETASVDELALINERRGHAAGAPTHYAIIGREKLRFAPPPDEEYTLNFGYWKTIRHLSDTRQDNWLLRDHPDIYLYASLVESAPYLKDDNRLPMWERTLAKRLISLDRHTQNVQWSGPIKATPRNPIP